MEDDDGGDAMILENEEEQQQDEEDEKEDPLLAAELPEKRKSNSVPKKSQQQQRQQPPAKKSRTAPRRFGVRFTFDTVTFKAILTYVDNFSDLACITVLPTSEVRIAAMNGAHVCFLHVTLERRALEPWVALPEDADEEELSSNAFDTFFNVRSWKTIVSRASTLGDTRGTITLLRDADETTFTFGHAGNLSEYVVQNMESDTSVPDVEQVFGAPRTRLRFELHELQTVCKLYSSSDVLKMRLEYRDARPEDLPRQSTDGARAAASSSSKTAAPEEEDGDADDDDEEAAERRMLQQQQKKKTAPPAPSSKPVLPPPSQRQRPLLLGRVEQSLLLSGLHDKEGVQIKLADRFEIVSKRLLDGAVPSAAASAAAATTTTTSSSSSSGKKKTAAVTSEDGMVSPAILSGARRRAVLLTDSPADFRKPPMPAVNLPAKYVSLALSFAGSRGVGESHVILELMDTQLSVFRFANADESVRVRCFVAPRMDDEEL